MVMEVKYGNNKRHGREKEKREKDDDNSKKKRRIDQWRRLKQTIKGTNKDSDDEEINQEPIQNETEEIDPLEVFMNSVISPEVEKQDSAGRVPQGKGYDSDKNNKIPARDSSLDFDYVSDFDDSRNEDYDDDDDDDDDDASTETIKKTKAEKLLSIDHSKIQYPAFRKNFYTEVKETSGMGLEEVSNYRKQLELVIGGKDVPNPIKTWPQAGLMNKILGVIKKLNYEKPMPVQAQALPVIMSGRDCLGIAKTGSGKTLAFVLPMLRHIRNQPQIMPGDGPIALILAPTRELVQQINCEIRRFTSVMGFKRVPVYGGCGVAQQIGKLKRGAEIVICTPGRMTDMLCANGGKVVNLHRVTYLVLDEADRMFDMGFEPQITRIIENTRPDRQTLLFSATFPRQVESLARKVLNKPVEILVGGKNVVNKDITQLVEVRPEGEKFFRLLEILGEWYGKGKVLTFVQSKDKCDSLFKDLIKHGYPCISFHGAKDQTDRESAISDFKSNVSNLLIATSVASRGLDVKEIELVVNYDVPNHYEDYVHRVGRTGRAGRKGCAITFISEEEARYAPELVKALTLSEQAVPKDLKSLAEGFKANLNKGPEHVHGSGYGGSGFRFNEAEDEVRRAVKKLIAKENGYEDDMSDSEDESNGVGNAAGVNMPAFAQLAGLSGASKINRAPTAATIPARNETAVQVPLNTLINLQRNLARIQARAIHEAVLEINDIPQHARWIMTRQESLGPVADRAGVAITVRGQHYPPGRNPNQGESKLHLSIEGPTESSVHRAVSELNHILHSINSYK